MTDRFRGVFPVFQTPLREDESIDLAQLTVELEWIAAQGASGFVFGMVSEALRLSDDERQDVIGVAANVAAGAGLPLIASVGAESTRVAVQRTVAAVAAGAAAVMATPPLLVAQPESELAGYFRTLLRESSVPVIVQDASAYVGDPLSIELQARLFDEFGPHVKFKPEAMPVEPAVRDLMTATGGGAEIFEGMGGGALLATYPAGVVGSMPGAEVCWAIVALWNALEHGDQAGAALIGDALAALLDMEQDLDSFIVCEKFLLVEQHVIRSAVSRSPIGFELDGARTATLRAALARLRTCVDGAMPPGRAGDPALVSHAAQTALGR